MFCNKCGNEIKEGDKFCSKCGNEVKEKNNKHRSSKKEKIIFIVGMLIFIIIIIIYIIGGEDKKDISNTVITNINNNLISEQQAQVEEVKNEIYGYFNDNRERITYTTLYDIDYQKELEDLNQAKNLILEDLINDKEIKFEGIGYLYFNQANKIYIAKVNSDTGDKFFTVY